MGTNIMLLNNAASVFLFAISAVLVSSAGVAASISCPSTITSHRYALVGARLFDGPPKELTELVPDNKAGGTWDISGYKNSDRSLILVCDYAKGKSRELLVPKTATSCSISGKRKFTVTCR